jgi:hypothetical protein
MFENKTLSALFGHSVYRLSISLLFCVNNVGSVVHDDSECAFQ